jgi:hypothetical protein
MKRYFFTLVLVLIAAACYANYQGKAAKKEAKRAEKSARMWKGLNARTFDHHSYKAMKKSRKANEKANDGK